MITKALAEAVARASELPAEEQEAIASLIRKELAADGRLDEAISASKHRLRRMAAAAIAEHQAGLTIPLPDPR